MTQRSHSISSMIAAVAAAAALGLPGMASAEYLHPTSDEVGVVVHRRCAPRASRMVIGARGSAGPEDKHVGGARTNVAEGATEGAVTDALDSLLALRRVR